MYTQLQAEVYFVFRMLHRWLETSKPEQLPCRLAALLRLLLRLVHRGTHGGKQVLEFILVDIVLGRLMAHECVVLAMQQAPLADLLQQLNERVRVARGSVHDRGTPRWAVQQLLLLRDSLPAMAAPDAFGDQDSVFACASWTGTDSGLVA